MRKGADTATTLDGIHAMVQRLNEQILPPGSEDRSVPRSRRSGALHDAHGAAQPDRRHDSGGDHSFYFSGKCARRLDRRVDDSICASVRVDLSGFAAHFREFAFAGRAGFRHGGGWRGGDGGEHRPPSEPAEPEYQLTPLDKIRQAAHEVQRPVFYAIAIIITAYLPIFTLQRVEGKLFKPMAWTVAFALLGALIFSMLVAPALASFLFRSGDERVAEPGDGVI